jgi:competence protein ComEA
VNDLRLACLVLALVAAGAALSLARGPRVLRPLPADAEEAVDLNRAGLDDLLTLPGVGAERARRILRLRRERGAFRTVDELLDVPGVGPKTLEALRPRIGVEAPR